MLMFISCCMVHVTIKFTCELHLHTYLCNKLVYKGVKLQILSSNVFNKEKMRMDLQ